MENIFYQVNGVYIVVFMDNDESNSIILQWPMQNLFKSLRTELIYQCILLLDIELID